VISALVSYSQPGGRFSSLSAGKFLDSTVKYTTTTPVSIECRLRPTHRSSIPGGCNRQVFFPFAIASRPALGITQLPTPGVKQPRREGDHSPPSNAEVKNTWNYTSTSPIRLHGVVPSTEYFFVAWYIITYFPSGFFPIHHSQSSSHSVLCNVRSGDGVVKETRNSTYAHRGSDLPLNCSSTLLIVTVIGS
jgi:hypothetical protein